MGIVTFIVFFFCQMEDIYFRLQDSYIIAEWRFRDEEAYLILIVFF